MSDIDLSEDGIDVSPEEFSATITESDIKGDRIRWKGDWFDICREDLSREVRSSEVDPSYSREDLIEMCVFGARIDRSAGEFVLVDSFSDG